METVAVGVGVVVVVEELTELSLVVDGVVLVGGPWTSVGSEPSNMMPFIVEVEPRAARVRVGTISGVAVGIDPPISSSGKGEAGSSTGRERRALLLDTFRNETSVFSVVQETLF